MKFFCISENLSFTAFDPVINGADDRGVKAVAEKFNSGETGFCIKRISDL